MGGSFFLLPHLNSSLFSFLSIFTVMMIVLSHPSLFLFQLKHSSTILHTFLSFWQRSSFSSVSFPFPHTAQFSLSSSRACIALLANISNSHIPPNQCYHFNSFNTLLYFYLSSLCFWHVSLCISNKSPSFCFWQFWFLWLSPAKINHNRLYINV